MNLNGIKLIEKRKHLHRLCLITENKVLEQNNRHLPTSLWCHEYSAAHSASWIVYQKLKNEWFLIKRLDLNISREICNQNLIICVIICIVDTFSKGWAYAVVFCLQRHYLNPFRFLALRLVSKNNRAPLRSVKNFTSPTSKKIVINSSLS